jgi:hypothetical protein
VTGSRLPLQRPAVNAVQSCNFISLVGFFFSLTS